jgi:hypothetical protein
VVYLGGHAPESTKKWFPKFSAVEKIPLKIMIFSAATKILSKYVLLSPAKKMPKTSLIFGEIFLAVHYHQK